MQRAFGTIVGKTIQSATRLRSGGQALPGLIVERLFPGYLRTMLSQLPDGVVIITGTNGKTTTTKMVVELLTSQGKRVVTNPTGSNLIRGLVSSLLQQATWSGALPYDVAVFEIDEAYAKQFVGQVTPEWVLGLNVSRDQLDRFGEVDVVAQLVGDTMRAASKGVVTNANDPRLTAIGQEIVGRGQQPVSYFGIASSLRHFFPTDNQLVSVETEDNADVPALTVGPQVELLDFDGQSATYAIDGSHYTTALQLTGQHNFQNAAAALALVHCLLPKAEPAKLVKQLQAVQTAFGRGQIFRLPNDSTVQLVLVKNPASFRQTIASYLTHGQKIMFVINDNYADSRDVSWLWDVDFSDLKSQLDASSITLASGSRAADMALRLQYADIAVATIEPDIDAALAQFSKLTEDKIIVATYTAMLHLYDKLTKGSAA